MLKNLLRNLSSQTRILLCLFLMLALCNTNLNAAETQAPANTAVAGTTITCADFLDKLNKKPKNLAFVGCKKINSHGSAALESSYRVKGADAKEVEAFLVKTAHMPKLRRVCCGWESSHQNLKTQEPNGVYKSGDDVYLVEMSSGETLVSHRSHWGGIPYFYVKVTLYLEMP